MIKKIVEKSKTLYKQIYEELVPPVQYYSPPYTMIKPKHITEIYNKQQFDAKLKQPKKQIMLNFYHGWNMDCKKLNPKIDRAAEESGKYIYLKIDIDGKDTDPMLLQYEVEDGPTIIILDKKLEEKSRFQHFLSDKQIAELMK